MTGPQPSPVSPQALDAARRTMLAAMAAIDGPSGYAAAYAVAAAVPAGRVLEVCATLAVLGGRHGELLLDAAMAAEIFGEATP